MRDRILSLLSSLTHVAIPALYAAMAPSSPAEVDAAIDALVAAGKVRRGGKTVRIA